jgi:hypothetical protein
MAVRDSGPGRGQYAPPPDQVPPPARLMPDPDLRTRMPELFEGAARDQVVAATVDIGRTTPATVRVVPNRGLRAGTASPGE